jgi:hypothetical protein
MKVKTKTAHHRRPRTVSASAAATAKIPISIRIAPMTLDAFRATGPGWMVRMNEALDAAAKIVSMPTLVTCEHCQESATRMPDGLIAHSCPEGRRARKAGAQ